MCTECVHGEGQIRKHSDRNEDFGNWRESDPCCEVVRNFTDLFWCSMEGRTHERGNRVFS